MILLYHTIIAILYNGINGIMSHNNHNRLSLDYNYSITIMIIRQVVLQLIIQRIYENKISRLSYNERDQEGDQSNNPT